MKVDKCDDCIHRFGWYCKAYQDNIDLIIDICKKRETSKAIEYRVEHRIKGTYADILIKTNHWAIVKFVQDAYIIVVNKIKEYDQIKKLKLNFFKKIKKEVK